MDFSLFCFLGLLTSVPARGGFWKPWEDHNYYFSGTAQASRATAHESCRQHGANLSSVLSANEIKFLDKTMKERGDHWIGLWVPTSCICEHSGSQCKTCRETWTWTDGSTMSWNQWNNDEPSGDDRTHCARLTKQPNEEKWLYFGDISCERELRFICKKHLCENKECVHGRCVAGGGEATCECDTGYTGNECQTDIDECGTDSSSVCQNGARCLNTQGSYRCDCQPGYTGANCHFDSGEFLQNVKTKDLVISITVAAILAAITLTILIVLSVYTYRVEHRHTDKSLTDYTVIMHKDKPRTTKEDQSTEICSS